MDIFLAFDEKGVWVGFEAVLIEDFGIRGFASANEENEVVASRKLLEVLDAIGDVLANGVVIDKRPLGC